MEPPLKSLKEVAELIGALAHRVIHLCETGLVKPVVDAAGRGSFRQFSRDNALRIVIALDLMNAGLKAEQIRPLMKALDKLMAIPEILAFRHQTHPFDLVEVIRWLGAREPGEKLPAHVWINLPSGRPTFITPGFPPPSNSGKVLLSFTPSVAGLMWTGPGIVYNLTSAANTLWLSWNVTPEEE